MSKISLSSNILGTGTLTIASPNTDTDRTLTLPDTTAPILAGSGITLSASAPANTLVTDASGNVGIGITPLVKIHTYAANSGTPTTSGSATTGVSARFQSSSVNFDIGTYGSGSCFIQPRLIGNNASNFDLVLQPNGGNLLVGTTGGGSYPSSRVTLSTNAGTTNWNVGPYSTATNFLVSSGSGGVQLVGAATSWSALSDERLKTDLKPIENAAAKVATLRAFTGRYKTDDVGVSRAFLIAQDVQAVLPEAVNFSGLPDSVEEYLGLQYTDTIPLLVAAIQELNAKVDAQAAEIAALKGQA